MRPHEVYMHFGLLDSVPKGGIQRRKIMDFIYSLREHPDTRGDFTDKDASLRERQILGSLDLGSWLYIFTSHPGRYAGRCQSFSPAGLPIIFPVAGSQRTTVFVR